MLVPLEAGDLLLWDSRLVHAGSVGPGRDLASDQLARASLCVCMGPRARASPAVIARYELNIVIAVKKIKNKITYSMD